MNGNSTQHKENMSEKQTRQKYDLYSQDSKDHIHAIFDRMRREKPWHLQPGMDGETPIWFVSKYDDVEALLRNDKAFVRDWQSLRDDGDGQLSDLEQLINNHMLNKDGEDHRRLRGLVSKAFTPKLVQGMRPHIQEIAEGLVAVVRPQGRMDLIADYAFQLPTIVIAEILGVPAEDRGRFKAWSTAFVTPAMDPETQAKHGQLIGEFVEYLRDIFAQRRADPQQDLISALLQAEEGGDRLNEQELFSMVVLLIVAGHETTVNLLGNAMLALFEHPEVMAALREHPEWMPRAVEEFLRYDGPVERALVRFAARDFAFHGQDFKKGDLVIGLLSSANRDESQFEHAAGLDIHRSHNPHIAFGKGVHYCLGAPLARLEGEIGINTLLGSLPGLRLAVPVSELRFRTVPMFRGLESLPVTWES